ncbi:MAG: hypothetical protein O2911_08935, partial [Bacteroidetes bacterium]|nr:hypothetical protein [Bacteroidota bacterium]
MRRSDPILKSIWRPFLTAAFVLYGYAVSAQCNLYIGSSGTTTTTVCQNQTVTITGNSISGATYAWEVYDGSSWSLMTETSESLTILTPPGSNLTRYYRRISTVSGTPCTTNTVSVFWPPAGSVTIAGGTSFCSGATGSVQLVATSGFSQYVWSGGAYTGSGASITATPTATTTY